MPLAKNKKIRNAHKAYVTKTIETVTKFLNEFDTALLSNTEKLRGWKLTLNEKKNTIINLDEAVLNEIGADKIDEEIYEASEFSENINRIIAKIDVAIETMKKGTAEASTVGTSHSFPSVTANVEPTTSTKLQAKLPKLTLGRFSGEPTKWQSFWASFESAVHNNKAISSVDKFNYLKGLLEGIAASAIAGLTLTSENYEAAVDILRKRFANPQLLISSHMDVLLKLQASNSSSDVKAARRLYDKIESHISSLQSLGVESKSYGSLLVPVIMSKIPEEMRLIVSRKFKQDTWDIDGMLDAFKTELEARERCFHMQAAGRNERNEEQYRRNKANSTNEESTVSTLHVDKDIICTYCQAKGKHSPIRCDVVTNTSARREILREKGKCFNCLRSAHIARDCPSKNNCYKCKRRHHTSLCDANEQTKDPVTKYDASTSTMFVNSNTAVLLQTAKANVYRPDRDNTISNVRVIFDSCSQRSYVTQCLAEQLNLPVIGQDNLLIKTFGEESARLRSCELVQIAVQTIDEMTVYVNAYVVPVICTPPSNQYIESATTNYPFLRGLDLAETSVDSNNEISMLIGADYYWSFMTGNIRRGEQPGPVAVQTKLGWVLSGPVAQATEERECTVNLSSTYVLRIETEICHTANQQNDIKQQLTRFWDLETMGIANDEPSMYDKFISEVKSNGERYEVCLPFKENHPRLPDNYEPTKKRLSSLVHRLQQKPDVLRMYDDVIQDQLKDGVIEKVNKEEYSPPGQVHYLPHREVIRYDKDTTKLRVVFDASASPSLNDCLYVGPPLSPLLCDILLRFRVHKIAMTADIEKAFLNIAIAPQHRDFLRFLWPHDPMKINSELDCFRFTGVVFGVNSSPFLLNATIRHHLESFQELDPDFVTEVLRSLYVDDYASGSSETNEAFTLVKKIQECFLQGGFNMRKWLSNSGELMNLLNDHDKSNMDNPRLRCHGRMQNAPVDFNSRYPILLPEDNHISKLIVMQCHNMVMHNGVRETLTQLRTKFWIVRDRQVVKMIISKCVVCQKIEGKGYGIPYPPPLPPFRFTDEFAFSRIGLDYAGPVYVKDIYTRTKMNKAYIALYTCASTRALHLDLVPELSSQAFLRSFRRFVARRGIPARVLSDNAKTFKSMDVDEYIRSIGVVWSYNIEGAPWWGDFFERMVKSVKRCLKKVIGSAKLTYEELLTILIEVECVLNSRPLTYVYDDATEPLTPSHLVLGKRLLTSSTNRSYGNQAEASSSRDELQKRAQHLEMVLNHFWNRWRKEYLTELREHHRRTRRSGKAVQVGDIVCVYEDKIPRQQWKLARIVYLFTGRDAEVRAAALRVCDKSGKVIEMRRPLQKLFPLEVENCNENDEKFPITFVKNAKEENVDV